MQYVTFIFFNGCLNFLRFVENDFPTRRGAEFKTDCFMRIFVLQVGVFLFFFCCSSVNSGVVQQEYAGEADHQQNVIYQIPDEGAGIAYVGQQEDVGHPQEEHHDHVIDYYVSMQYYFVLNIFLESCVIMHLKSLNTVGIQLSSLSTQAGICRYIVQSYC